LPAPRRRRLRCLPAGWWRYGSCLRSRPANEASSDGESWAYQRRSRSLPAGQQYLL